MNAAVLAGYAEAAPDLIARFEALSSADLYEPVARYLPQDPARILDLGAGTGRDAAWFAAQGHRVVAVEPVAPLREAGQSRHASPRIDWIDDTLPDLDRVRGRAEIFDLVLISGVWQHLDNARRRAAVPRIRTLIAPGGCLVLSLRHGPGAPSRPVFAARVADAVAWASAHGLRLVFEIATDSIQARNRAVGVTWTWLVFRAP